MKNREIEITIPESLNDIKLRDYVDITTMINDYPDDLETIYPIIISRICNISVDEARGVKYSDMGYIVNQIVTVLNEEPKLVRRFEMNGTKYGFLPNLSEISFGEYIDLDTIINDTNQLHKVMSILYREVEYSKGDYYTIKEYTGKEDSNVMLDAPMDAVKSSLVFFYTLEKELLIHLNNSLEKEMKKMKKSSSKE